MDLGGNFQIKGGTMLTEAMPWFISGISLGFVAAIVFIFAALIKYMPKR